MPIGQALLLGLGLEKVPGVHGDVRKINGRTGLDWYLRLPIESESEFIGLCFIHS